MGLDGLIETIRGREASRYTLTDGPEDISGGVTEPMTGATGDGDSATLYLSTEGVVDVTVEFSPDGGSTWREPSAESPVQFDSAGEDLVHIDYNATDIRLTGSNGTAVDADLRVVA
jgi:hypothetical protein